MRWKFFLTGTLLLSFVAPAWAQRQLVDRVVAVVNNEAITQSELELYLRPLYETFKQQYEGPELARQLADARLKLLKQMIEDRLVFQEAEAQKLTVDEAEIDPMVSEFKGRFASETEMEEAMAREGFNLTKLRERYRRQILIRKLQDMQVRSRIVVSPLEIEDYYKNHSSELAEEDQVKVQSITLRKGEEAAEKGLTDELAKARIGAVEKRIRAGESFEALARELSEDEHASQGGLAGWLKRGEMLPAIDEVLFKFQAGEISPVLETSRGYHLFKVLEKKVSRTPSLEETREGIRTLIFRQKAQKRFEEWMEELKRRAYISIR